MTTPTSTKAEIDQALPELPEPLCWVDWHGSSVAGEGGGWMQCSPGFGKAAFTAQQMRSFAASRVSTLLNLLADLKWRINDIRDGLMGGGSGHSVYGVDEWSTPAVNLKLAAGLIDAINAENSSATEAIAAERAEVERLREILRSWKAAQDYTEQYSHLPEARDDISGAWESAIQAREAALATPTQGG